MKPTLCNGEFVLIDPNRDIAEGVVLVADHPNLPEMMIKRVQSLDERGIWLLSDNSEVGTDSRRFGAVAPTSVHGVVTLILNRPVTPLDSVG